MNHYTAIQLCEPLDDFDWDPIDVRDLVESSPLRFGDDGQPVGYEAEQLFGLEVAYAD